MITTNNNSSILGCGRHLTRTRCANAAAEHSLAMRGKYLIDRVLHCTFL